MKVTVVGAGYVGLSMATLLSDSHDVCVVDLDTDKIEMIKAGVSPLDDQLIKDKLCSLKTLLTATSRLSDVVAGSDFVIVATPTNYDPTTNKFDVASVKSVCLQVACLEPQAQIVIKSTIPIGFVSELRSEIEDVRVFFSPEFLREGNALYDNLNPARVVVGSHSEEAQKFAEMLVDASNNPSCPIIYLDDREAEAVKLFANGYLAMRVGYFNELDNFAMKYGLDAKGIIKAVCMDPRIGDYYNNPSFGYGGYCFPKDTKQLLANYHGIDNALIKAIVDSNSVRKTSIANAISERVKHTVGIYKLAMKEGSDNYRSAAILDVIEKLKSNHLEVLVYDPSIQESSVFGCEVIRCFDLFISRCELVATNRADERLVDSGCELFTRDLFGKDV